MYQWFTPNHCHVSLEKNDGTCWKLRHELRWDLVFVPPILPHCLSLCYLRRRLPRGYWQCRTRFSQIRPLWMCVCVCVPTWSTCVFPLSLSRCVFCLRPSCGQICDAILLAAFSFAYFLSTRIFLYFSATFWVWFDVIYVYLMYVALCMTSVEADVHNLIVTIVFILFHFLCGT